RYRADELLLIHAVTPFSGLPAIVPCRWIRLHLGMTTAERISVQPRCHVPALGAPQPRPRRPVGLAPPGAGSVTGHLAAVDVQDLPWVSQKNPALPAAGRDQAGGDALGGRRDDGRPLAP